MEEKTTKCAKCGKEKKESEGNYVLEGSTFCCEKCCGKQEDAKHGEDANMCEFC